MTKVPSSPPPAPPRHLDYEASSYSYGGYEPEDKSLIDKIRSHPKVAAAVLVLSGVAGTVTGANHFLSVEKPAHDPAEQVEEATQANVETGVPIEGSTPEPEALASVSDKPIERDPLDSLFDSVGGIYQEAEPVSAAEISAKYSAEFAGSYKSSIGIEFNLFATDSDGEVHDETQKIAVNPETIEYLLTNITESLEHAPESSAKQALQENLSAIERGDERRIINMIISVGDGPECLDDDMQIIVFQEQLCRALGVANITLDKEGNERVEQTVIVSAGVSYGSRKEVRDGQEWIVYDVPEAGSAKSVSTAGHEMIHAIGDGSIMDPDANTYLEGDDAHKLIEYIMGHNDGEDRNGKPYDFEGASKPSPMLEQTIIELVESGRLKPILEVVPR